MLKSNIRAPVKTEAQGTGDYLTLIFSGSQEERGAEEAERQGQALEQDQGDEGGRGARKGKNIIVFGHIEYCNIIGIIHQRS